ncbi:hypothetical protein GCM10027168_70040 [Streptomyces capparidis]
MLGALPGPGGTATAGAVGGTGGVSAHVSDGTCGVPARVSALAAATPRLAPPRSVPPYPDVLRVRRGW